MSAQDRTTPPAAPAAGGAGAPAAGRTGVPSAERPPLAAGGRAPRGGPVGTGRQVDPHADGGTAARAAMVRAMVAAGGLRDAAWRAAFEGVPRHLFVPSYYVGLGSRQERRWCGDPDPRRQQRWLEGAYTDRPLATRVRDGELLSSSSQPSLMAEMLAALHVRDGDRILEIGAGTGYNAALLSHRLGEGRVTTVDLDPEITESARAHLAAAGFRPSVVTGDGARGCPAGAPYDRILATCALARVPDVWLGQCTPGALILAPVATGLIALRVTDPAHAEGRFLHTSAYFVPLRGGPEPHRPDPADLPPGARRHEPFSFFLALTGGGDDPEPAYELWKRAGRPSRERFGISVRGGRQWAWLDEPDGPHVWPLTHG